MDWVRPGGSRPGADDNKVLITYQTSSTLFEDDGFDVTLLEHFDKDGEVLAARNATKLAEDQATW